MKNHYFIGTDIGGTTFSSAVFGQDLTLQAASDKCQTSMFNSIDGLLDAIANQISVLSENRSISGVGFACPGPLDAGKGIILGTPNLTLLQNCKIKKEMEKRLNLPCLIENDANLFALGEWQEYSGKKDVFAGITLGTGLGFGIIINGQLFTGAHGMAAEYGISPVQWGKWETAISIDGVISLGKEKTGKEMTPRELNEEADKQDRTALSVWNNFGVKLGACLIHIINMLDPDAISISGGLSHAFVHFENSMRETIKNHSPAYNHYTIDIFESIEKEIAAKRGAAMLLIST